MIFLRGGSFAEYAAVRPMEVALKPRSLSMVDAAGVAAAALTAWQALHNVLRIRSGQRILIHAAAGGVGMFAVQMAKLAGAQVVATASAANCDFVRSLGADDVIDYRSTRFDEAVGDLDAVMDNVGGEVLERSWKVLRPGGTLATAADQIDPTAVPAGFYGKRIQVQPDAKDLSEIAALIDGGQLRIMTSQVLSLADGRAALDLSETGHVRGKLVLQVC
jgi:NADPH:quinone reductase-like Zn-dependent oxidoreductase